MEQVQIQKKIRKQYTQEEKEALLKYYEFDKCIGFTKFCRIYGIAKSTMRDLLKQGGRVEQKTYKKFNWEVEKVIGREINQLMEGAKNEAFCDKKKLKEDIKTLYCQYFSEKQDFIYLIPKKGDNKRNTKQNWVNKQMKKFEMMLQN